MKRTVLGLLMLLAVCNPRKALCEPRGFREMSSSEVERVLQATAEEIPLPSERLLRYSGLFLGMPYSLYPLGIAPNNGKESPSIRFDAADCTTMIETLIAMSFSSNLKEAEWNMSRIRYKDGVVDLKSKNQYAETDWIPNNIRAGFLVDITERVAGRDLRIARKDIRTRIFSDAEVRSFAALIGKSPSKALASLRAGSSGWNYKVKKASLSYLPLEKIPEAAAAIPSGSIFSLVRENRPDKDILVTHQGLIVKKGDGPYVRHMAFKGKGEDVPLLQFFKRYENDSWKVVGIHLAFLENARR